MRLTRSILIILLVLSINTTSCEKHEIINPEDKQSSLATETINRENFDYGDELNFYMNDEKTNNNPTAISVVKKYLEAIKENDYDTWLSTLTPEKQKGFSREMNGDFGSHPKRGN